MLSKKVCKKCVKTQPASDGVVIPWDPKDDEDSWKDGFMRCPISNHPKVDSDPPKRCPRKFEHAVAKALEESSEC